jgi:hypothetical protein
VLPPISSVTRASRWIDVFNRGDAPYRFEAMTDVAWLKIEPKSGTVERTVRLTVDADWETVPAGVTNASLTIKTHTGESFVVQVPIENPDALPPRAFKGFIESDRTVAIEAPHYTRAINEKTARWRTLPNFGRTEGGVSISPVTAETRTPSGNSARLEYDFFLQSSGELQVDLHCAPSLDFQSGEGLRIAVSIDDAAAQVLKLDTYAKENWERAVAENIRRVTSTHTVARSGKHTLKVWLVTPGVVLERVVIDAGGVRSSYLGPPESARR